MLGLPIKAVPLGTFFFNDTATTEIYTLSLHDALPISHLGVLSVLLPWLLVDTRQPDLLPVPVAERLSIWFQMIAKVAYRQKANYRLNQAFTQRLYSSILLRSVRDW